MELARCEHVERRENIMPEACFQHDALGNSGTGKSHIALGLAACQKGLSVSFTAAAAIVHELATRCACCVSLVAYELLIVDELGYVSLFEVMIAAGYEDCDDVDALRADPALKIACGHPRPAPI